MSGNIAEKLGLGNEVREFKLGKSFTEKTGNAFHSVRYDFKPASVDTTKMANVDIGESNQVTVTVPHIEGTAQTVFRGSRRPYQKECVLIIDHNTGQITLEKLSTNIQLKKTRAEGSSRALQARPITPIENPPASTNSAKKTSPNNSHSQNMRYSPKNSGLSPGNGNRSWNSPQTSPTLDENISPSMPSMPNILAQTQSSSSSTFRSGHKESRNNSQALPPSMPQLLGKDNTLIVEPQDDDVGVLSDSSGSDSSSSSGEEEEDHDEEKIREPHDELEAILLGDQEPMDTSGPITIKDSHSSSGSSSGSSSDSDDSEDGSPDKNPSNHVTKPPPSGISPPKAPKGSNSALSMPKFSQLSEDLQLSESGSDSDD